MHEFRVATEDFIALPRDPAILFSLAIGILGDVAAAAADKIVSDVDAQADLLPIPLGWDERDPTPVEGLRFASVFFDAYLNARLDNGISLEFSLLCASAYYLAGNVGSAAVIVRQMEPPSHELAGGLGLLVFAILANRFDPIYGDHVHADRSAS